MEFNANWGPSLTDSNGSPTDKTVTDSQSQSESVKDERVRVSELERELKDMQTKVKEQSLYIALQDRQMEVLQRQSNELRSAALRSDTELSKNRTKISELQKALTSQIQSSERRENHVKRLKEKLAEMEITHAQAQQQLSELSLSQRRRGSKQQQQQQRSESDSRAVRNESHRENVQRVTEKQSESQSNEPIEVKKVTNVQRKSQKKQKSQSQSQSVTSQPQNSVTAQGKTAKNTAQSENTLVKNSKKQTVPKQSLSESQNSVSNAHKSVGKRKNKNKKKQSTPPPAGPRAEDVGGLAGFMVNMLTPGVQSDAISALNWVFALLFLSIVVMIVYGKASFHFGVFGLLALGLFGSVQYYLAEASKLDGVLNPTEEQLEREAEEIKALKAKREAEKNKQ